MAFIHPPPKECDSVQTKAMYSVQVLPKHLFSTVDFKKKGGLGPVEALGTVLECLELHGIHAAIGLRCG